MDCDMKLVEMWDDERYSLLEICSILSLSMHGVQAAKKRLGLGRRTVHSYRKIDAKCDAMAPSVEEIAARAAEVRAQWTPEEEARRLVGASAHSWRPPLVGNACCQ